jgi:Spy/CpxP family protein refolding chaperone
MGEEVGMKVSMKVRLGLTIAAVLMAGTVSAQGPGGMGMGQGGGPGGGPGFGQHRPPMERAFGQQGEMGRWWNNPRMVEQLKLTDEQRKAMDGILQEHKMKLVDLRGSLQKAELELEPMVKQDQPNETALLAQIDKVAQARADLEKANARFLLALRGKLTPDQWKQVQAFRENGGMQRRGMGPMGNGGQGRGQGQGGWRQGGQGPGGQGPGGMYRHQGPPPPPAAAPQGSTPPASGPGAGDTQ